MQIQTNQLLLLYTCFLLHFELLVSIISQQKNTKLVGAGKPCIMVQIVTERGSPSMHFCDQLVLWPCHKVQPAAKAVRLKFARPRFP